MFTDELQVLVPKIVAHRPEFLGEANQALKNQFAQNLRYPYFGVVARGQHLSPPDQSSWCNDHEGAPENISGHSI